MAGYIATEGVCRKCWDANPGCLNCSYDDGHNGTVPFNVSLFTCLYCDSSYDYSDAQTCMICLVTGCLNCSATDANLCSRCDPTMGYYDNATSHQCSTLCGDGIYVTATEGCDDNNTDDFDGCSAGCSIEAGFICTGSPSDCYFAPNATLNLHSVQMDSTLCNRITFEFTLSPTSAILAQPFIVWDAFLTTPNATLLDLPSATFSYNGGILGASYLLLQDLQNSTLLFEADYSTLLPNSSLFSHTSPSTVLVPVSTAPPALFQCCAGFITTSSAQCQEICGDGLLFGLECDDGNLVDGDGCSSNCTVESDHVCINGSSITPSVCSYSGPIGLTLETGDKDPNRNEMTLRYELKGSAALVQLNNGSLDFRSLVSFPANEGVTVTEAYIDPSTNELVIKIAYTKHLQDTDLTLQLTPPNVPQAFALSNMTNTWKVQPTNQLAARLYSAGDYQDQDKVAIVANLVADAYLGVMLLTVAYRKFIGLELATLIQFGYLSLLQNKEITVYAEPISTWKYVFGYDELYYSSVPKQRYLFSYAIYGYEPNFGYSNNFMLIITYAIYGLALLLLLFSRLTKKGTALRIRRVSFVVATDIAYTLVVFLSPSILTAFCIEVKEGVFFDWSLTWSSNFMVAALLLLGIAHCVSLGTAADSTDVDTFLTKNNYGIYMPIIFNIRLALLALLLFFYHISE
jgi:cysteine-rich repeat protein